GDGGTSTAPAPMHTYNTPGVYTATLTVNDTHVGVGTSQRIVAGNRAPTAAITAPSNGAHYSGGDTINFPGPGTDPEDGPLGPSAFSWTILFHHNTHVHPFSGPSSGMTSGSFVTAVNTETDPNVAYEIVLNVTDTGSPVGSSATLTDSKS